MPAKKSAAFLLVEQQAFISPFASQKYFTKLYINRSRGMTT